MKLKWPFKDMAVGDVAIIRGVPIGKAKNYLYTYTYISGKRFTSARKESATGDYLVVLRLSDNGSEPALTGTKHRMEVGNGSE
jgi:hypothetical protein